VLAAVLQAATLAERECIRLACRAGSLFGSFKLKARQLRAILLQRFVREGDLSMAHAAGWR
jgi:hypothetical protein